MLSHISFINFLMGLCRSSTIAMMAIAVRIISRYFGLTSVFLGTNDSYGFMTNIFNLQALPDGVLWGYMLLLRQYSKQVTHTYADSNITNILMEYPWLKKVDCLLVILRIFNWISYILFSLLILSRHPSLFVVIHIACLVAVVLVDTMVRE